jgi:hypothetical protein
LSFIFIFFEMAAAFVPQITNIVAVRNEHTLGFTRISFTPCDAATNTELSAEQKKLVQYRYRVRLWKRRAMSEDDLPVLDRLFVKESAEPLVDVTVDPASRFRLDVEAIRPDGTAYGAQPVTLVDQCTRLGALQLAFDPKDYQEEVAKIISYTPQHGHDLGVTKINVLFANQRGVGKSSTINSMASVMARTRYVDAALSRPAQGGGVTYAFDVVRSEAAINLIDSPGVNFDGMDVETMCVLFDYVVRGRIKLPYKLPGRDRVPSADELRAAYFNVPDAPLRDRVHVVVIAFDGDTFLNEAYANKMHRLIDTVSKTARVVGLVTGADRLRRVPMFGKEQEFAGVDEYEIEANLGRVTQYAEANEHMLTMASNAQMDVKNVLLTSNLLGASPRDDDAHGRCVLTANALRVVLDRGDDLFAAEYARHLDSFERESGHAFNDEEAEAQAAIAMVQAMQDGAIAPNPHPPRLRPGAHRP